MRTLSLLLLLVGSFASAQELRAWQDLYFADNPETVQAKMVAMQESGTITPSSRRGNQPYAATSRFPERNSFYPMSLAGVDVSLEFEFYDSKLYMLDFTSDRVSATEWESTILPSYATLRAVLVQALGRPTTSRELGFFDTTPGFISWGDVWTSGGVTRRLGIAESTGYEYRVRLRIEWDWMSAFIASQEDAAADDAIDEAADGF